MTSDDSTASSISGAFQTCKKFQVLRPPGQDSGWSPWSAELRSWAYEGHCNNTMLSGSKFRATGGRISSARSPVPLQIPRVASHGSDSVETEDPEAKYKRYGPWSGQSFKLPSFWSESPRVRVRTNDSRARDDLLEIAMLNERLSGELEVRMEFHRSHG